jgi:predicted MFS family arabinose efflux permease
MGLLAAAQGLPVLLFSVSAGVWVDRIRRRPLMIACDLGRAVLLLTVPAAAVFDGLAMGQLYAVAFGVGLLETGFELAYRSYLPALVGREEIMAANSRLAASESVAESASPALGGAVVQVASGPAAVFVDALTFIWSATLFALIRRPEPEPVRSDGRTMLADAAEGLALVWRERVLRALTAAAATSRFFGGFYAALYGVFLIQTLGFSPLAMGITVGAGGLGSLAGAALAEPMSRRFGLGPSLIVSKLALAVASLPLVLAGGPTELAFAMIFAAQLMGDPFWTTYEVGSLTLRQSITPERFLGRVNSALHIVQSGLQPVGALAAGLLAEAIGVRETLYVAVAGGTLSVLWLVASPVRDLREVAPKAVVD